MDGGGRSADHGPMPRTAPTESATVNDGDQRRIVLIGLRASGKSTVARALAARRGLEAVDLDDRVRAAFGGRTVPEIWATDGEPAFRAAEVTCLAAALGDLAEPPTILSLGGGTPQVPAAAAMLAEQVASGRIHVVYLRAGAARLVQRLSRDRGDRPPLTAPAGGEDPVAVEVAWALDTRDAAYRKLATLTVELDEVLGEDPRAEPADGVDRVAAFIDRALGRGAHDPRGA